MEYWEACVYVCTIFLATAAYNLTQDTMSQYILLRVYMCTQAYKFQYGATSQLES